MIKTFRGIMTHGAEQRIRLSTKKGKIGYRIVKFQTIAKTPGGSIYEGLIKIYKITQASVDGVIDFSDGNLLGAAYLEGDNSTGNTDSMNIIFDQEIFNQDIYLTYNDYSANASPMNYYLELETINMTDNAAAVSTLRDIRLNPQVGA